MFDRPGKSLSRSRAAQLAAQKRARAEQAEREAFQLNNQANLLEAAGRCQEAQRVRDKAIDANSRSIKLNRDADYHEEDSQTAPFS